MLEAFERLIAEGYLDVRAGSGTFVTRTLPEDLLMASPQVSGPTPLTLPRRPLSQRYLAQEAMNIPIEPPAAVPFAPGVPGLDAFPHELWRQLVHTHGREMDADLKAYQNSGGYPPLRRAIAAYLTTARGVRSTAEQVIIVSGSQQGISLAAHVILNPGEAAWMEEPGYFGARGALLGAGARLVPVAVETRKFRWKKASGDARTRVWPASRPPVICHWASP